MADEYLWYAGQTRSGLGPWAEKNLKAQTEHVVAVYTPRIVGPDGVTGENLFSRYVLVKIRKHQRSFTAVNSTRGMQKLLPLRCEEPLSLPDGYVEDLMARVGRMGTLDDAEEVTRSYAKDDPIWVTHGPFIGEHGLYQYRKRGVAMMMMRILGAERLVPISLAATRPIATLVSEIPAC